jgi:hypothetical protein
MLTFFGTTFSGQNEQITAKVRFHNNRQKFLNGPCRASKSGTGNWRKGVTLMASGIETVFAAERATTATVLIVDDENITRELCRDIVAESG